MKVRFVLPDPQGGSPLFDKTVALSAAPLPGETVGIDPPSGSPGAGTGSALLVEVEYRRWYVDGEEPVVECWLGDSEAARRRNLYVHSGCRYGFEQMMASLVLGGRR